MANLIEDRSFIDAALRGFEKQREVIDQKMAELRQKLSSVPGGRQKQASAEKPRTRRELSPEARERITAAQRRRWARARREKAAQGVSTR